ncbi:MAG: hypothetical protein QM756_45480 [Polyangiaceae bacterium]
MNGLKAAAGAMLGGARLAGAMLGGAMLGAVSAGGGSEASDFASKMLAASSSDVDDVGAASAGLLSAMGATLGMPRAGEG